MSEGITGEQLAAGVLTIYKEITVIPHADILTLPTAVVVILPPTEVLNFVGIPTQLLRPVGVNLIVDTRAGAYTNEDPACHFEVNFGSDANVRWITFQSADVNTPLSFVGFSVVDVPLFQGTLTTPGPNTDNHQHHIAPSSASLTGDILLDNGIALACVNELAGNFQGGHVNNKIIVELLYTIKDLP